MEPKYDAEVSVRVTSEMLAQVAVRAAEEHMTVAVWIRAAISQRLQDEHALTAAAILASLGRPAT